MPVKILGLNWQGGKFTHPFDIINVPHRAGVYKLHYQEQDGSWTVFLIGETRNLYQTLVTYLSSADLDERVRSQVRSGRCGYSYAVLTEADDRKGALRSLFDHFQPALNDPKTIPAVSQPVEINPN